jgi:hypothetical protein
MTDWHGEGSAGGACSGEFPMQSKGRVYVGKLLEQGDR